MRELVPIEIKIKRKRIRANMQNAFPDFNSLDRNVRQSMDWSMYMDEHGIGLHYSRDGFGRGADPHTQICATCVPPEFAQAAADKFPDLVRILTAEEWRRFYEDDCNCDQPEHVYDAEVLQSLAAKKTLGLELTQDDNKALDEDSPLAGIRKNRRKRWQDRAADLNVRVVDP